MRRPIVIGGDDVFVLAEGVERIEASRARPGVLGDVGLMEIDGTDEVVRIEEIRYRTDGSKGVLVVVLRNGRHVLVPGSSETA